MAKSKLKQPKQSKQPPVTAAQRNQISRARGIKRSICRVLDFYKADIVEVTPVACFLIENCLSGANSAKQRQAMIECFEKSIAAGTSGTFPPVS